jgi:hypothetical protein
MTPAKNIRFNGVLYEIVASYMHEGAARSHLAKDKRLRLTRHVLRGHKPWLVLRPIEDTPANDHSYFYR